MPLLISHTPANRFRFVEASCELDPTSSQAEPVTIGELQKQVKNYIDYMVKGRSVDPDNVFLAATVRIDTLLKIIASNPNCGGIRIYLTKDTAFNSGVENDIWPLLVPVSHPDAANTYTDLISDDQEPLKSGLVTNFLCRNPPCLRPYKGSKLLPDGYKE
ncbi:hypothetical protein GGR92_001624 [Spirosoma lacussanchae]|uniref:hypothetical protein n=1 Tax=Spirosoma lacussanchae TaxID=1884249 RepID=UPI001109B2FD|nr:hypothetical protein [Spirosoma lacussanchae]